MHRCLLIAEIFSSIVSFSESSYSKTDLYNLALTCKAFSEIALDELWSDVDDFMALVYLLPAELWHGTNSDASECCMTRETVPSDWTRFLVHARRVKALTYQTLWEYRIKAIKPPWNTEVFKSNTVLQHLHQQCPLPNLLPRLRALIWRIVDTEILPLFICPSLQSLSFGSTVHRPATLEVMEASAHLLTSLDLQDYDPDMHDVSPELVNRACTLIKRMERLRSFQTTFAIRSDAMAHLARLPKLGQLVVLLAGDHTDHTAINLPSRPLFPSLSSLVVRSSNFMPFTSFLSAISSKSLGTMRWVTDNGNPDGLLKVSDVLSKHPSLGALRSLAIRMHGDFGVDAPATLEAFRPLLKLKNLTHLEMSIPSLYVTNEDLKEIASNLPNLFLLKLGEGSDFPPRVTLSGLAALFHHCKLQFLDITVDATEALPAEEFHVPSNYPDHAWTNSDRLQFLNLFNSPISPSKVEDIALFLNEFFPNLVALGAWNDALTDVYADPREEEPSSRDLWEQAAAKYAELRALFKHRYADDDGTGWHGFNQ
ncbi:hypothetical protein R3P38DRAFT_536732 [Favolaschia claudopus]|uniref:F-box domain-containing protein n=1 Tax=Favolaschia claudopus TaxID=2862362 RepID=A0AAW0CDG0_9AGAR